MGSLFINGKENNAFQSFESSRNKLSQIKFEMLNDFLMFCGKYLLKKSA